MAQHFDIASARFAFVDLETTGLSPWFGDRVCQIAVIVTEGKRIKETFDTLVNPERELSPVAAHVNQLSVEDLSNAPTFEELIPKVEALLKDSIVVCHNAQFDIQFFDSEYRRLERSVQFPNLVDTLLIARQYFEFLSYSLPSLASAFNVPIQYQGSRARADALTTKNLFFAMMESMKELNKPLDEFIGIYSSPAWPDEGVYLPTELSEAINSGKRLYIHYADKNGEVSERWISPIQVTGLADYIYLQAYCHTRKAERSFRMDRILEVKVEE
jgi:DNA polymerase III epsilon subunit family exonuclease